MKKRKLNDAIAKVELESHMEVIGAFLAQICAFRNEFANYIGKWELYEHLTRNETEFMNEISIACQKFLDNEVTKSVKEIK